MMRRFGGFIAAIVLSTAIGSWADCPERFRAGIDLYKQERYEEATQAWESCLRENFRFADLHYNLGNAYYRQGQIGQAIRHYLAALRYAPADPDIRANLRLAEQRTIDRPEASAIEENPVLKALWSAHHAWSANTQWIVLVVLAWVFSGLVALSWMVTSEKARWWIHFSLVVIASGAGVVSLSVLAKIWEAETRTHAVVLTRATDVMSGPGERYQVLHELHEGTVVEVRDQRDGWMSVRLGEQVNGFIRAGDLGVVE